MQIHAGPWEHQNFTVQLGSRKTWLHHSRTDRPLGAKVTSSRPRRPRSLRKPWGGKNLKRRFTGQPPPGCSPHQQPDITDPTETRPWRVDQAPAVTPLPQFLVNLLSSTKSETLSLFWKNISSSHPHSSHKRWSLLTSITLWARETHRLMSSFTSISSCVLQSARRRDGRQLRRDDRRLQAGARRRERGCLPPT